MDLPMLSKWKRRGLCQTLGTRIPGFGHPFLGASTFIFVMNTSALFFKVIKMNVNRLLDVFIARFLEYFWTLILVWALTCTFQRNHFWWLWIDHYRLQTSSRTSEHPNLQRQRWEPAEGYRPIKSLWIPCKAPTPRVSCAGLKWGFGGVDNT